MYANIYVHRTHVNGRHKEITIPRTSKKNQLTRERIIDSAMGIADEQGLEALSMRGLAKHLGFGVMSLYNHVSDKDDLLDAMADAAASEIRTSKVPTAWKTDLRRCLISAYKVMLGHRWLSSLWGRPPGPAKNGYHEAVLRIMREAQFPEELACRGFHALTMHVVGFATQVLDMPFSNKKEFVALGNKSLEELDEQEFPYLREHIQFHLDGKDERSDFKFMLDLLLDGLERDLTSSRETR